MHIKATLVEVKIIVENRMSFQFILEFLLVLIISSKAIHSQEFHNETLEKAKLCILDACQLPDCRCSGLPLPILDFEDQEDKIPQLVTITFDDAVTTLNFPQYQELFADLQNSDNCKVRGTFFVTHEYTDYSKVHALAMTGHEIALHSITHGTGTEYWSKITEKTLMEEFGGQISMLNRFGNIPKEDIKGLRLPFLQMSGNTSYSVAKKLNLTYDSSWPTQNIVMWPYTLDYKSKQDCSIGVCPDASIQGFWVNPMNSWIDTAGYSCAMLDGCVFPPNGDDHDALLSWMHENFNRHYEGNRAPFGIYLHSAWFARGPSHFSALRKFLEDINKLPNVYITTMSKVIEYMRKPVLGALKLDCPRASRITTCRPKTCVSSKGPWGEMRYMTVCGRCPSKYPWLGNPMGKFSI